MPGALQLELNLWDQIRQAEAAPTAIACRQICLYFDAESERMLRREQLEQGAEAIRSLAELLAMRAEAYFEEWQQRYNPVGPSLEINDFSDLIRQSFSLDLDELITETEPTYRLPNQTEHFINSQVSEISKDELLAMLEDSEIGQDNLNIEKMEYAKDVSAGITVVRSRLEAIGRQAELMEVIRETAMSPVMVWMALLLGGFELEKHWDFYKGVVIVG